MSSKQQSDVIEQEADVFTYPPLPSGSSGQASGRTSGKPGWPGARGAKSAVDPAAVELREKEIYQRGFQAASANAQAEYEKKLATLKSEIGKSLEAFASERESYFERVEQEVVRLTLAIARKILHREAQVDPLLLTGVLRVALEKISLATKTRLRVNPVDVRIWSDYFQQAGDSFPAPELIGDPGVQAFRCILETDLGNTEIGLETQLKEIEQGFLDLLSQRPGPV